MNKPEMMIFTSEAPESVQKYVEGLIAARGENYASACCMLVQMGNAINALTNLLMPDPVEEKITEIQGYIAQIIDPSFYVLVNNTSLYLAQISATTDEQRRALHQSLAAALNSDMERMIQLLNEPLPPVAAENNVIPFPTNPNLH